MRHLPPEDRKWFLKANHPANWLWVQDSKFTGFNTMDKFLHHIETDSLVKQSFCLWGKSPLSHAAFASKSGKGLCIYT